MTLSLTSPQTRRVDRVSDSAGISLTRGESTASRSREQVLRYAAKELKNLRVRQANPSIQPYVTVLRLIDAVTPVSAPSPTPQVSDNGEHGILVEWIVSGRTLSLDYEDEDEIALLLSDSEGVAIDAVLTSRHARSEQLSRAKKALAEMGSRVVRPLPLNRWQM